MLTLKHNRFQINHLSFYLKKLKREKQTKPECSRRKEIRAEINEIHSKKKKEKKKENKTKSSFFSKKIIK